MYYCPAFSGSLTQKYWAIVTPEDWLQDLGSYSSSSWPLPCPTVLEISALHSNILQCTVLPWKMKHCTVLYCTSFSWNWLHCTAQCTVLRFNALYWISHTYTALNTSSTMVHFFTLQWPGSGPMGGERLDWHHHPTPQNGVFFISLHWFYCIDITTVTLGQMASWTYA